MNKRNTIRLENVECHASVQAFPELGFASVELLGVGANVIVRLSRESLLRLSDGLRVAALALALPEEKT